MFELNKDLQIETEYLEDKPIYIIDNFYKNPEKIEDYFFNRDVPLWKINEKHSYNNIYFEDRRLGKLDEKLIPVYDFLSKLCNQKYLKPYISTNMTCFYKNSFNDYKNCFWWPHIDNGYNGIVYFNDDCGTNLYKDLGWDTDSIEHFEPWRPKAYYDIIKTLKAKYNRMVLFDGTIYHAMNIYNDKYFGKEYRKNQVFFFIES